MMHSQLRIWDTRNGWVGECLCGWQSPLIASRYGAQVAVSNHIKQSNSLPDPGKETIGKHQRPGDAAVTQQEAAYLAYPATGTQRRHVLAALYRSGEHGATDEELQRTLSMNPSTQRPRRVELVEGGWVEDSERTRPTTSGRAAVVWVLTERGQREYRR